jgi:uncharacterized protein HemX
MEEHNEHNQGQPPHEQQPMQAQGDPATMESPQEPTSDPPQAKKKSKIGSTIGIIVIVVVLILVALYFWGAKLNNDAATDAFIAELEAQQIETDAILEQEAALVELLEAQGTSDDIGDIEADLDATNLGDLDIDLSDIDL